MTRLVRFFNENNEYMEAYVKSIKKEDIMPQLDIFVASVEYTDDTWMQIYNVNGVLMGYFEDEDGNEVDF